MTKNIILGILILVSGTVAGQVQTHVIGDSVLIHSNTSTGELILENSTKNVNGFLHNKGNGRTEFSKVLVKLSDSIYIIGGDTLRVNPAVYTASNGLTMTSNNVKLGGTLIENTTITGGQYTVTSTFDNLGGASGLKLSSTSTAAASNLQRLLEVNLSGTNATGAQTTTAGYFSNLHKGTNSTNIALEAIADSGTNNWAGRFTGNVYINGSGSSTGTGISFYLGSFAGSDLYIKRNSNTLIFNAPGYQTLAGGLDIYRYNPIDGHVWYTQNPATAKVFIKANGSFLVGTSIDSGALVTFHSTTKGFLQPRMTTTQRNAISSPAIGLSLYNTTLNTNDTYNGSEYFSFGTQIKIPATNTTAGTTGNQTINKVSGTVNIAASGTAVTVTNSLVTASSIVYAVIRTNDTTAYIKNVVPGAGTFTINLGAAATAEVSIGFVVFN